MHTRDILAALNAEIAQLRSVRYLLADSASTKRRGRPLGSSSHSKKRTMSAAGKKRIAEAQRKRWAKQKAAKK
jgi:hypothetical protein